MYCINHVPQSINILGSYVGNRQDAREAIEIAARGEVTVYYDVKGLGSLKEYVFANLSDQRLIVPQYI
jgi:D-arabinose 1-dehydrogenase-like Zn-dependent alcohol dehydrogenase